MILAKILKRLDISKRALILKEKICHGKNIWVGVTLLRKFRYHRLLRTLNCFIPTNVSIGSDCVFPHGLNGIFISQGAIIGNGCTIFHQVTIGSNTLVDSKSQGAPVIGNNVYIGAGAKIIGGIKVGDNVRIGANAVVCEDIPDNSTVVMIKPRIILHTNNGIIYLMHIKNKQLNNREHLKKTISF